MVPFATQRSDAWKMEEVPQKLDVQDPWQRDDLIRRGLRLADLERRLKDAKAFVEAILEVVQRLPRLYGRSNNSKSQRLHLS